jgi:hypothetical protein
MQRYLWTLLVLCFWVTPQAAAASVLINEVDADNYGSDTAEFIELFDGGTGGTALDGLVVVLYNGSTDTVYNRFDLAGYRTRDTGYFVLGGAAVSADFLIAADSWLQNGADAIALHEGSVLDFPTGNPVTTGNLIDALVYDTNDADDPGLLQLLNPGQPQINEDEGGNAALFSMQRYPDGSGGARNTTAYYLAEPTPGSSNGGIAAVPLPSSVMFLLSGLVGMVSVKRRKGTGQFH